MDLLTANDRPGAHAPSWYAATATPPGPFPAPPGNLRAEVCVVGGGYTGLSAALHLAQAGIDVVLIDAQRVGWGASGRNGGQVGTGQRQDQRWLAARLGDDAARALWEIAEAGKRAVRDIVRDHAPDARWTAGVLEAQRSPAAARHAGAYADHLRDVYGYDDTEPLDRAAVRAATGSDVFAGGVLDHGAGHLHPLRLAFGIARAAAAAGARLHERTVATDIRPGPGGVRVAWSSGAERGAITADHVVLAANGYLGGLSRSVAARVMPINNFVVATEPLGPDRAHILPGDIAVADDRFVVNYWRRSEDGRLLFGGGESYGYRFPADIAALVRRPLARIYPDLADLRIDSAWGGTLAITRSRMPHFARPGPGIWSASGYSGHGVAMAVMAGRLVATAIRGETAGWDAMAALRAAPFPGGGALRAPLLTLAMAWYAARDRAGI